jgi:hypothetical protein
MQSLKQAIAYAVGRNRIPVRQTDPPVSVKGLSYDVGLSPPISLAKLIGTLLLPGNFMPGQPLATGNEIGEGTSWYQADLFGIALDGTPWKFWEYNDGPWQYGAIRNEEFAQAGVPVTVWSTWAWGLKSFVLQMYAPAFTENGVAIFNQIPSGQWDPLLVRIDAVVPGRAYLVRYFQENSFFAVDGSGTLRLFRPAGDGPINPTLPLQSLAISPPGFAPPGAPLAVDFRVIGLLDGVDQGGDLNVFVVDNNGTLWAFDNSDLGDTWQGVMMPNPNGVKLNPGAHIATGFQVAVDAEGNSLGYSQLDVLVVDAFGNLQVWWESQGSEWHQQPMPDGSGLPPGAPIATGLQVYELPWKNTPIGNQLDVFVVDLNGKLSRWWVYRSGTWARDQLPDTYSLPAGAHLATANQQVDGDRLFHQLDVFAVGKDGRIVVFWQTEEYPWTTEIMLGSDLAVPPPPM